MKISCNWLSKYIDIPYSIEELAEKLTMAGIEVEDIITPNAIPDGVVVGEVIEREPHPDADSLSVCKVSNGTEELQVVCGASNCDVGVKTALATVGTKFNDNGKIFKIKKSKLRGIESFGMMCSTKELGIEGDSSGIIELSSDEKVGTPLSKVMKTDTVFEIETTPNRPDWLSHWGVARDLIALTGGELKFPKFSSPKPSKIDKRFDDIVEVKEIELCPRYTARIIRNVKVEASPDWLQKNIISIGLRPINNIVDITNYVLHELGQPLHAFDLAKLAGNKIVVRSAKSAEKFTTLDNQEIELNESHLVIADAEKPVALAGVTGGANSGVTETTVDILLESAMFNPSNIRATARDFHFSTDSSFRFERGTDFKMVETASDRAASLILEIAGGELVTDYIDVKQNDYSSHSVSCRYDKIKKLIGVDISNDEIIEIFKRLSFNITEETDSLCVVTPPSFRLDIFREADLAEEVARIYGLNKIEVKRVSAISGGTLQQDAYSKTEKIRNEFIDLGLYECINYSMIDEKAALTDTSFAKDDLIRIKNPLSLGLEYMRPSLFANMLETVERNISRGNDNLALFEIGNVFCGNSEIHKEERYECSIALSGQIHPERFSSEREDIYDFYDIKGMLESLLEKRKIANYSFQQTENANFAKGLCAELIINNKSVCVFGQINSKFTKSMRIKYPLFVATIQLDLLLKVKEKSILFEQMSQFPATTRDVAFIANKRLEHNTVIDFIKKCKLKNLESIELFDIFEDDNMDNNKKSMAYSMTFRNKERTLNDKEVNKAYEFIRKKLQNDLNVELR